MRRPHLRFTVRETLIAVASMAAVFALISFIEKTLHTNSIAYLESQESQWQNAAGEALRAGRNTEAARFISLRDGCASEAQWHKKQLSKVPRRLSSGSWLVILGYAWAATLFLVVREERMAKGPEVRVDCPLRSFATWFKLGFVSPIAMMTLGFVFHRDRPFSGAQPWPASLIEVLLWLQVIEVLLGVIILKGWRWQAFGIANLSILASLWIALHAFMSVTGVWL